MQSKMLFMNIIIITYGSRGDVQLFLPLLVKSLSVKKLANAIVEAESKTIVSVSVYRLIESYVSD